MTAITSRENQAVSSLVSGVNAGIYTAPLSRFVRSKLNVRKKKGTKIEVLATLIISQGLLQNLIGYEQIKKGKSTGIIEIVAGGRRLDALNLLLSRGQINKDFIVHFKMVSEEEAISISLSENSGREDMCAADQFEAMKELIALNKSVEDVAAAFSMSPVTVQRRLKLANVSPRLFDLFRNDQINIDQMMALAQVDDHAAQEQVWDSLPEHSRAAPRIRQMLTQNEVDIKTDPVARYVGTAAYVKAGGVIRRDLFSDGDSGFMTDPILLQSVAQAKLKKAAKQVEKEGFAWVEVHPHLDYSERNAYGHAKTINREPTEEEQAELAALKAEDVKLQADYLAAGDDENADYTALEERGDALEARMEALDSALAIPDPDDQKVSGAIVTIADDGKLLILRNLIRPEDKRLLNSASKADTQPKEKTVHSERLTRQLTAHRTAALQAVLMTRPDVALVALTARLAKSVFNKYGYVESVVKVSLTTAYLNTHAEDIEESRAGKELQAKREEWESRIPSTDEQSLFSWLLNQPQSVALDLLAFCTACSLDTVQPRESAVPEFNEVAKAIDLNMSNWWTPTKQTYLGSVSKARIIEVVANTLSPEAAQPLSSMKKDALVEAAERSLAGTNWLPDLMKIA